MKRSLGIVALSLAPLGARADQVTIFAAADNTMYSESVSESNGAGAWIFAGRTNTGDLRRALIRFDLSAIPAGATINDVKLQMRLSKARTGTDTVKIHRANASWGEGTSDATANEGKGAPAAAGDATWGFRFFNTTSWSVLGGDFNAAASASEAIGTSIGVYTWDDPGLTSDVAAWMQSPPSNFGWVVIGDESINQTSRRFDSRNGTVPADAPHIIVNYTPPCDADLNHDGFVNGDDYDLFASFFENGESGADLNHDGFVNGDDYDFFASHFEEGC
ncbi:MAG: DNRLRE domain-containing protein [Phycisphaerales bacterium]|nr:DNRLRE domain-containing protein [Phycisphaerales bacterium]